MTRDSRFALVRPNLQAVPALLDLWLETFVLHHGLDPEYYVPDSPALRIDMEDYLVEMITNQSQELVVASDATGKPQGMVMFYAESADYFDTAIAKFVYISEILVRDSERGHGLGRQLMDAVEAWAQQQGLSCIKLHASLANRGALGFYEGLGYKARQVALFKNL